MEGSTLPKYSATRILVLLSALAAMLMLAFMFYNIKGPSEFTLPFRGGKLLALVTVAYSIAVSTVLFQTVTHNRILTPSIMGFDQLYLLIQTVIIFIAGSLHLGWFNQTSGFFISSALLILFAGTLFRWLFTGCGKSLHLVLLVGIVFGVFFRSLTNLLNRMIDPNAFAVLQDRFFANFNTYDGNILVIAIIIVCLVSFAGWRLRHSFDVLALGQETAVNLGVDYRRTVTSILFLITILVSVSTALVGPVTFFGLLVASLTYQLSGTAQHSVILPMAILIAIIALVGGQFVLERIFQFNTALSIIIEFIGGIVFLLLLLKGKVR